MLAKNQMTEREIPVCIASIGSWQQVYEVVQTEVQWRLYEEVF